MQKLSTAFRTLVSIFVVFVFSFFIFSFVRAEPNCDQTSGLSSGDLEYCIGKIGRDIEALKPAHERNKQELANLNSQIASFKKRIDAISAQLSALAQNITEREVDLGVTQAAYDQAANADYKLGRLWNPTISLIAPDFSELVRMVMSIRTAIEELRKTMDEYAADLLQLKTDKDNLEKSQISLASSKKRLDEQAAFLGAEVAKVESYLATLSAKQQSFIAQKLGSLNLPTSLGAGPLYCTDDRNLNPGFSPAFAFYTFGIPHRVGMNQYGAYGRASVGQNHEEILKAYFNNVNFETKPNINIAVDGYGSMPLETYLLGIYEMPESWPLEALKAQAIAARSYALAYTNNGSKSICTSQSCQVYKQPPKSGNWKTAVEQTSGKVMTQGGQVITGWYASTAGGYTFTSSDVGWGARDWTKRLRDTTGDVSGFGDLQASAYDKASPCFYAAQGFRSQYAKSAWLKSDEVADIANVILLARNNPSLKPHLYQVDKPNPEGVDTWDANRVRQELGASAISSATSVSITGVDWGTGRTTQVSINGVSFDANEFKDFFNLRAPANIQIVGPLFNVERK